MGIIISYFINRSICIKCYKKIPNLHFDKLCYTCYLAESYFNKIIELPSAKIIELTSDKIIELPSDKIIELSEWSIVSNKQSLLEMPDFLPNLLNYTESQEPLDILDESSITETEPSTPPEILLENHLIRSEAALTPNLRPA